jgi:hypothetical protein
MPGAKWKIWAMWGDWEEQGKKQGW